MKPSHFKTFLFTLLASSAVHAEVVAPGSTAGAVVTPTPPACNQTGGVPCTNQTTPAVYTDEQLAQMKADQQAAAQAKQQAMQQAMQAASSALSSLGGGGSAPQSQSANSTNSAENDFSDNFQGPMPPRGDCKTPPDPAMMSSYQHCLSQASSAVQGKYALIVNMDQRIGYLLHPDGTRECFTITIGSGGQSGTGSCGPQNKNKTESGMFFTQVQNGALYQSNNSDWDRKGISMGISCGKVLHSDHGNNNTAGCIGIQQTVWPHVFNSLGTSGSPVYVWGKNHSGCAHGNDNTPSSSSGSGAGGSGGQTAQ